MCHRPGRLATTNPLRYKDLNSAKGLFRIPTEPCVGWTVRDIKCYGYDALRGHRPAAVFPHDGSLCAEPVYELDPKGFDVAAWFAANQNN
jgi:hypothetical protein